MHELDTWSTRRKATKCEPLSLLGKLFFAVRVVPVGSLFLHRLITLALTVAHLYHQIYLNAEASANITWWQTFLPTWYGTANSVLAVDMLLYTDTSGSHGCGAYYKCLVPPRLATTPTPPVNPVESAVHNCGSSFDVGAPMAGKTGEIHIRQSGDCPRVAGPVLRRLSHHEPYAHPICVCCTSPFHHHNTTSPRQTNSLADAISSKQFTKLFLLLHRHSEAHPDSGNTRHHLTRHLQHLLHHSLAWSARQSYQTGLKHFICFCRTQHVHPLPATGQTATYFATALHKQGMAPVNVCLYLPAVRACHWENGFADPCKDNPLLTLVKHRVTRSSKRLPDQRQPITYTILRHLICHPKSDQHLPKPDCTMLPEAFCFAFHILLRVSEYTAPSNKAFRPQLYTTLCNIQWHSKHFSLFLK